MKRLAAFGAAAVLAVAAPARAQAGLRLGTDVSARRVEVGETFQLTVSAMVGAGEAPPSRPRLKLPPGITAQGPSVTTQQNVSIVGTQIERREGITATWLLRASRPGRTTLGPASVEVGGRTVGGQPVVVEVLPAGSVPRPPVDPFDVFRRQMPGFPPVPGLGLDDFGADELEGSAPTYPDELATDRPLDSLAFLRATIVPSQAVVGQQMVLKIMAYGARGPFREASATEPIRPDFVSHPVVEGSYGQRLYRVPIEGQIWTAVKVHEWILFPLRAGNLDIGPARMGFAGRGYPATDQTGLSRQSAPLQVVVTEPPLQDRPAGYRLGDVGRFTLSASVQPREVAAGDAVSVVVTLKGSGNLPAALSPPQQHGADWLEPTVADAIDVKPNEVSGWRKFSYLVRLEQPGRIDLGEVALPYWDPARRSYAIARAGLGSVDVRPSPNAAADTATGPDPFADLASPRRALGPLASRPFRPASHGWFWGLLGFGPLLVLAARGSTQLWRGLRDRLRTRRQSHAARIADALRDARATADVAAAASAVERALFLAVEKATGLRARALLREELPARLGAAGLAPDLVAASIELLEALDATRFTGQQPGGSSAELATRAEALTERLLRRAG